MRRNRVLTILAVLLASAAAVSWLSNALAEASLLVNEGLTVDEGSTDTVINNTVLRAEDDENPIANLTFTLVALPAHGFLRLDDAQLDLNDEFTQADIDAGLVRYDHDDSENASDSFQFTVATDSGPSVVPTTTFVITVNPVFDNPPVVNNQTFEIPENSAVDTPVGTVVATDEDFEDSLTYSILNSSPATAFVIGSSTGEIRVSDSGPLDFETNPVFTLLVEVEDSGNLTDTATITINLLDVNEAPVITPAGPFSIPEDAKKDDVVGTITATDDDAGDSLTFSIIGGNTGGVFALNPINSFSCQIVVAESGRLDYEAANNYKLTIEAQDTGGEFDTTEVEINVTNVNEPPVVTAATFDVDENSPAGTPVDTVEAVDPDEGDTMTFGINNGNTGSTFAIHPDTGLITVANNSLLDFEELGNTPHFTLTVVVTDTGGLTGSAEIIINVNDVNEPPTVNDATFSIDENSAVGTVVGTVIASDPEGPVTFAIIGGNATSAFAIGPGSGQITVANSTPLNYEVTPTFNLTVQVTDNGEPDGNFKSNTAVITINLIDKNEAPTVNDATFSIPEDSPNGTVVGTVTASDPDTVDTLTFSIIGGNVPAAFAINPTTGQITVNDSTKLNANTMPIYNLTVQVLDKGNLSDTATITIEVDPLPITHIYLPIMLNNYPPVEPNNHCGQAYAISSGITYEFMSDDQEDWYAYTQTSPGNIVVTLSNFDPVEGQLVIYGGVCDSGLVALQNNGNNQTTKIINLGMRPAGTYYIRVYSKPVTNTTYNLRVN